MSESRCHRRGIACEQPVHTRKRKAQTPPVPAPVPAPAPVEPPSSTRLEEKLDDLVSLLRSQAMEKQAQPRAQTPQLTPLSTPSDNNTPSTTSVTMGCDDSSYSAPPRGPDVAIDITTSVVHLLRPNSPHPTYSPIFDYVSLYDVSERMAEEQLYTFRSAFVTMFPFVHIPGTMSALELRHQKPFLWLVMICLTTKSVSQQFTMESTIWDIISRRIVSEHLADIDLLLGVVCFASWSHYFKKDKPFMNMLAQVAVSLASELGLHRDVPTYMLRRGYSNQTLAQKYPVEQIRTLEERRTILAVFHLTSSTWTTYRKVEPLRWTRYLDECLRILGEGGETMMDHLLVTQVKCQLLTKQLACVSTDESLEEEDSKSPSAVLTAALLGQLEDVWRNLPALIRSERIAQFYLYSAKLTIQASLLSRPSAQDHSSLARFRKLQDLDSTLTTIERWLAVFFEMPLFNWVGITVDIFAQFTHCLVVLFKLTTLNETGWDLAEVRRRADVFEVLDRASEAIDRVPATLGIVDVDGPRKGLFFKTPYLLRTIKALFLAQMAPEPQPDAWQSPQNNVSGDLNGAGGSLDSLIPDEVLMGLWDEPWLSDILVPF
ncbi:hypothetical protein HD806DRAFT_535520 [Xylariaceae sp. AK1471]|nr:hypothetical protein HD806DRAFT_535520 [Xylariaceae sp. AK1471]